MLLFSQMTRALDLIQDMLEMRGHSHLRLDGSTSTEERCATKGSAQPAADCGAAVPKVVCFGPRQPGDLLLDWAACSICRPQQSRRNPSTHSCSTWMRALCRGIGLPEARCGRVTGTLDLKHALPGLQMRLSHLVVL